MAVHGSLSPSGSAIAAKMSLVMSDCAHVKKNGYNTFHRYAYVLASDVLEAANASMVKHGVAVTVKYALTQVIGEPPRVKTDPSQVFVVEAAVTFIDIDTGESLTSVGLGSGTDTGDKAIMKAETAALKYAVMSTLFISTGDDPEADESTDRGVETRTATPVAKPPSAKPPTVAKPPVGKSADLLAIQSAFNRLVELSIAKRGMTAEQVLERVLEKSHAVNLESVSLSWLKNTLAAMESATVEKSLVDMDNEELRAYANALKPRSGMKSPIPSVDKGREELLAWVDTARATMTK